MGLADIRKPDDDDVVQGEGNAPLPESRLFRELDHLLHIQPYWIPNRLHIGWDIQSRCATCRFKMFRNLKPDRFFSRRHMDHPPSPCPATISPPIFPFLPEVQRKEVVG